MSTVNDLFTKALALYDEISKTGAVDASKTADYKARTPFLTDMLQKELWETADFTKIYEFNYDVADGLLKVTLPTGFKSIKKVILSYTGCDYLPFNNYRIEKDGSTYYLYMRFNQSCTVRIQYKPFPTTVTSIDDDLELDEITLQGIAYGLAKWFAISEQNEFVTKFCDFKFQEIKNTKFKEPVYEESILDVYAGW